jgi:hypothetical protein
VYSRTLAQSGVFVSVLALKDDGGMAVQHHYRLTKYDPTLRDETGAYTGDDWTTFADIGQTFRGEPLTLATYLDVEVRHLVVLASFLEESGTTRVVAEGVEASSDAFRVSEGMELSPTQAVEAVRQILRDEGWCRLVDADRFYIHVGWDYYLYVGTEQPCERSVALAKSHGLFVDRDFPSPHRPRD